MKMRFLVATAVAAVFVLPAALAVKADEAQLAFERSAPGLVDLAVGPKTPLGVDARESQASKLVTSARSPASPSSRFAVESAQAVAMGAAQAVAYHRRL